MKSPRALLAFGAALTAVTFAASPAFAAGHHHRAEKILVAAHPSRVLANGTATSTIAVKLQHAPAGTNSVSLAAAGTCGSLAASTGNANRAGRFSTTYTSSSTVGFCTVTATSGSLSASVTIDQIDPSLAASDTHFTVSASANPSVLKADGTSTSQITFTALNGSSPVSGDPVMAVARSLQKGACGGLSAGGATDGNGQFVFTYTASTARGNCFVRVTEAATGQSAVVVLHQGH